MTEIPALDLVADRKVVKTARWNSSDPKAPRGRGPLGELLSFLR